MHAHDIAVKPCPMESVMPNAPFANERRSQTDRRRSCSIPVARSLCIKCATISFEGALPKGPFFAKALCNLALHLARHPA